MKIIPRENGSERNVTEFESHGAHAAALASGNGETHVYRLRFDAGGEIGRHMAGFDQIFVVLEGEGWAEGEDGERRRIGPGDIVRFHRGETHAKGSESGMTALMIQVKTLKGHEGAA